MIFAVFTKLTLVLLNNAKGPPLGYLQMHQPKVRLQRLVNNYSEVRKIHLCLVGISNPNLRFHISGIFHKKNYYWNGLIIPG